jgi:hypothetical protein
MEFRAFLPTHPVYRYGQCSSGKKKRNRRKREKQKGNTYYFLMCLHQLVTKYLLRKQEKIGWLHTDKDNAAVESKEKEEKNKNERKRGREENKSS